MLLGLFLLLPGSAEAASVTLSSTARVLTCTPEPVWTPDTTVVTYQWSLNTQPVPGATGATIPLTTAGAYTCNLVGMALSTGVPSRDTASLEVRDTFSPEAFEKTIIDVYVVGFLASSTESACSKARTQSKYVARCARGFTAIATAVTAIATDAQAGLPIVAGECSKKEPLAEKRFRALAADYTKLAKNVRQLGPKEALRRLRTGSQSKAASAEVTAFIRACAPR